VKKTLVELYALTVCFGAMGFIAVYSALGLYDVVCVVAPKTTLSGYVLWSYETNERFLESWRRNHKDEPAPDDASVTALRLKERDAEIRSQKQDRTQDLVKALCFIAVNLSVFAIHWRVAKNQRNAQPVA
jgi:hypothetical protein